MSKKHPFDEQYETLVITFLQAKKEASQSFIELGNVISQALSTLGERKWKIWLKDSRVGLKLTQAYKFIAVTKFLKNNIQLTEGLKHTGIEKAYLITKLEDDTAKEELAEKIIDADFTVKQTKQIVSKIKKENKTPAQAIEEIKNLPKVSKTNPEKIPISTKYKQLQSDYDALLKEKKELEEKIKLLSNNNKTIDAKNTSFEGTEILKEPIDSDEPDFTIDEKLHAITYKGKKIPVSSTIKLDPNNKSYLEIIVKQEAKNKFNLDL